MKPINPQIIELPGHVVQQVDVRTTISNVVTLICENNARPTMMRVFTPAVLRSWRRVALIKAGSPGLEDLVSALRSTERDAANPTQLFLRWYAEVAAAMICEPSYHQNAGEKLADDLLLSKSWGKEYVSSPSLGYPRQYLSLLADPGVAVQPFGLPAWQDIGDAPRSASDTKEIFANGGSDDGSFRDAIAQICMLIDRPLLTDTLIPAAKELVSRDPKEPHWGTARAAIEQTDRLTAIGLLYVHQADAFWLRVSATLFKLCYDMAYALYPRERPMLEFALRIYERARDIIPCHPLLESIASMYASVTMQTYYGQRPVAFRHGPDAVGGSDPIHESTATLASGSSNSRLAQLMVAQAVAEYSRLAALSRDGATWPADLLGEIAPNLSAETISKLLPTQNSPIRTFGTAVEWIARNERYVRLWPIAARNLGWSGAVRAPAIQIDAAGADFVITDGDLYTSTPVAVLAGLRPGLSMANRKVTGFPRRFQTDFNTGADALTSPSVNNGGAPEPVAILWSTITATGHISSARGAEALSRFYMPTGMSMGEEGAESRFCSPEVSDPIGKSIMAIYADRSSRGYVKHWYGTPDRTTSRAEPDVAYIHTDWDAWSYGSQPAIVQQTLLAGYGSSNIDKGPVEVYLYRDKFNQRTPVKMARTGAFEWFNEIGEKKDQVTFDGHVVFDDTLDLTQSVASIDAYVELLKVSAPRVEDPNLGEIKSPEA